MGTGGSGGGATTASTSSDFTSVFKSASSAQSNADTALTLAQSQALNSSRNIDTARVILSVSIIGIYVLSVLGVLLYFGYRTQQAGFAPPNRDVIDPYSGAMLDVLKVVVLPVVTFMLGFYFGTGGSAGRPQTDKAQ